MRNILLALFLLPFFGIGQVESARKTVETLCSPAFHGRGYVNGGDSLAAEYIAQQFKDIGCKFYNKSPFQAFTFPVNTFPKRVQLTVNGSALVSGEDFVVAPDCGTSLGYELTCSTIPLRGILNQASLDSFVLAHKTLYSNKVAFAINMDSYKGDTLKQARKILSQINAKYIVLEIMNDKFTWSVEQTQRTYPLVQIQRRTIPESENFTIALTVDAKIINHNARNVIAMIPAKKKTKKTFVFSAHYDHLGQMGDSAYFPGGNDNASGTAMLIEMARYFKEHPSNVNVVFMAFAGEEVGLLGSQYYVENPIFPLSNIQFLFNLDIMGSGEEGVTIVNATEFPTEFQALQDINSMQGFLPVVKSRGKAANSDHYFFTEKGVPAFFMYTMGPNKHYHDVGDTYENLSFDKFNSIYQLLIDFEEVVTMKKKKK